MYQEGTHEAAESGKGLFWRAHYYFNLAFEALRYRYMGLLAWSLAHRGPVLSAFMGSSLASLGLLFLVGEDFFPTVDTGQMRLHVRCPVGTRIEETEVRFSAVEREVRNVIPRDQLASIIDNIGIPNSWTAIAQGDIPTISSADGEMLISLNEKHSSTRDYEVLLRKSLKRVFPEMSFFFNRPTLQVRSSALGCLLLLICKSSVVTRRQIIKSPSIWPAKLPPSPARPTFMSIRSWISPNSVSTWIV